MSLRQAAEMSLEYLDSGITHYNKKQELITALKEALAQPEQEPVAWKGITGDYGFPFLSFHEQPGMEPLYLHPALIPEWKDHNTAQLVNELTEIAIKYRDMQQLRERIAYVIRPLADKVKSTST